jgi:hypothetical protein
LLALLGLIAPGLVYQQRRERRRPMSGESGFREASRVALSSLIFSTAALAIMLPLTSSVQTLPDVTAWLTNPKAYLAAHYAKVATFLVLVTVIACALALVIEAVIGSSVAPQIAPVSIWYAAFRRDVPPGTSRIWVWITTDNGTQFKGPLRSYTPSEGGAVREIALGGAPMQRLAAGNDPATTWTSLDGWDLVVVTTDDIRHFAVSYLDAQGNTLMAAPWTPRYRRLASTTLVRLRLRRSAVN